MLEPTQTAGSIVTSAADKRRLAKHSRQFNLKDETFCELFPEVSTSHSSLVSHACNVGIRSSIFAPEHSLTFRQSMSRAFILCVSRSWQLFRARATFLVGSVVDPRVTRFVAPRL